MILEVLLDAVIDTLKLLPFLFLTYLLMEYLESRTGEKSADALGRMGKIGPLFGGAVGVVPQCGPFSCPLQMKCFPFLFRRQLHLRRSSGSF